MLNNLKLESDELNELIAARIEFDKAMLLKPIEKDATGNRGAYLSLENLQEHTIAVMAPLGLSIKQTTVVDNGNEYLVTTLRHKSGQYERSVAYLFKHEPEMDGELAKLAGSMMTYTQRYQWRSMLCVGRGQDDIESSKGSYNKQASQQKVTSSGPKMSLAHQAEILKIIKGDTEAVQELCRVLDVARFEELADSEFEKLKRLAQELAKAWGI